MFGRTNGINAVHRLREEMDHLFENFFTPTTAQTMAGTAFTRGYPAVNVWEDEDSLYAEAEVPGLTMDDLEVFVVGNELTIKGERKDGEQQGYHRRERGVGRFQRVIPLPMPIDADRVEATLHDGVLQIRMPKAEVARPRRIEVKAS
jgi:HSP20 family protein